MPRNRYPESESTKIARKQWFEKNREKVRDYNRVWRANNKDVMKRHATKWREANPEKWKAISRKAYLRRLYGLTPESYEAMLVKQGFSCAICGIPHYLTSKDLAVDHDHDTGAIRGLLCGPCNQGLGFFMDRPEIVEVAKGYLIKGGA